MIQFNTSYGSHERNLEPSVHSVEPVYTREAFRAILSRQPEWKIRDALEEGNIPSANVGDALEWLEEQAQKHNGYWS
jgi:hypothetical protein